MTKEQLDAKDLLADSLFGLARLMELPTPTLGAIGPARLLSRRWSVFQIPSSSTPNYYHFVVGSKKDGFRCSCIGYQSHGACYHVRAVVGFLNDTKYPTRRMMNGQMTASASTPRGSLRSERSSRAGGRGSPRYKGRQGQRQRKARGQR